MQGRALRTAAIISTVLYVVTDVSLAPRLSNTGVWITFLAMYAFRAVSLAAFSSGLIRAADPETPG